MQILTALYHPLPVHIHFVRRQPDLLHQLQELERERNSTLSADDPDFPSDRFEWIQDPGVHFVYEKDTQTLVLACRVT